MPQSAPGTLKPGSSKREGRGKRGPGRQTGRQKKRGGEGSGVIGKNY